MVEMAIVLPVLCFMLFGIIELGMLFKDAIVVFQATREGGRQAALGATPSAIAAQIRDSAPTLNPDNLQITLTYRTWSNGAWSEWVTLGTKADGSENNAPTGAQVRVQVNYPHPLLLGGLFSFLASRPGTNQVDLRATVIARRE
jgi:Flp pilus assembly protein TadG